MKSLASALVLLALFFAPALSSAAEVTYVAEMKGIECAGCKKTISRALGKIKGVKTIRIEKVGGEKHRLTVVTDGRAPISRAQADASLGRDSHYQILSWNKAG